MILLMMQNFLIVLFKKIHLLNFSYGLLMALTGLKILG